MTQCVELWKPVVGLEGYYEVSNLGRVRRIPGLHSKPYVPFLKPFPYKCGRLYVCLCVDNQRVYKTVHGLVAGAFIGPRPEGMTVDHVDGDKLNNVATNLEYVTPRENVQRAERMGLRPRGAERTQAKLTEEQVREIRRLAGTMIDREIAAAFGVARSTINGIKHRKYYADVN